MGHGPITDPQGVAWLTGYLEYLATAVCQRYNAGVSAMDAARDMALDAYATWSAAERIVVYVQTLYRACSGETTLGDIVALFGHMAQLARVL